jgi:hypothetical protein
MSLDSAGDRNPKNEKHALGVKCENEKQKKNKKCDFLIKNEFVKILKVGLPLANGQHG